VDTTAPPTDATSVRAATDAGSVPRLFIGCIDIEIP
jgi:hypothetical protein